MNQKKERRIMTIKAQIQMLDMIMKDYRQETSLWCVRSQLKARLKEMEDKA